MASVLSSSQSAPELALPSKKQHTRQTLSRKPKKKAASVARLASGQSSVNIDVGGNTAKGAAAMGELVALNGGAATVEGGMRLKAIVNGEVDQQPVPDEQDKLSYFEGKDTRLMEALATPPGTRSEDQIDLIERHCTWHPMFKDLRPMLRRKIFGALRVRTFKMGGVVVVQGQAADAFYIVYQGELSVHVSKDAEHWLRLEKDAPKFLARPIARSKSELFANAGEMIGSRVAMLRKGNSFGENGLDPSGRGIRTATVVACDDVETIVFVLLRSDLMDDTSSSSRQKTFGPIDHKFVRLLGVDLEERSEEDIAYMETKIGWHPFLKDLDEEVRTEVISKMSIDRYVKDDVLVLQDDRADSYYIVYQGAVGIWQQSTRSGQAQLDVWKGERIEAAKKDAREFRSFLDSEVDHQVFVKELDVEAEATAPKAGTFDNKADALAAASARRNRLDGPEGYTNTSAHVIDSRHEVPSALLGRLVAKLGEGCTFGENSLRVKDTARREASIVAASNVLLTIKLSREDIVLEDEEQERAADEEEEEDVGDAGMVMRMREMSMRTSPVEMVIIQRSDSGTILKAPVVIDEVEAKMRKKALATANEEDEDTEDEDDDEATKTTSPKSVLEQQPWRKISTKADVPPPRSRRRTLLGSLSEALAGAGHYLRLEVRRATPPPRRRKKQQPNNHKNTGAAPSKKSLSLAEAKRRDDHINNTLGFAHK